MNMAEILDELDKKILFELLKDSTQSYSEIADAINSKKTNVAYHIKELLSKKIITKFVPVFSLNKMGIFYSKMYVRIKSVLKEKEILENLIKNKKISWLAKSEGKYNLLLGFYSKNIKELSFIRQEIFSELGDYVENYEILQVEDQLIFNKDYLADSQKKEFISQSRNSKEIDDKDAQIIAAMKHNSRIEMTEISKKLSLDPRTIISKINSLKENGIYQGNTIFIDLQKIEYKSYKILISLKNFKSESQEQLINFCKENKNIVQITKLLGNYEIELEIEQKYKDEVEKCINVLKKNFDNIIKEIEIIIISEELKQNFAPEWRGNI
jgi:Lrp/AsnC family leucine-responsive transcriptional regulator